MVRFSFVIPTLNEQAYIGDCLRSIRAQTVGDHEVIVVDSRSRDKTVKVARRYGAKVLFEAKKGPGAARNTGAKAAKGKFLVFADADVRFESDFLERLGTEFSKGIAGGVPKLGAHDADCSSHAMAYRWINRVARFFIATGSALTTGSCFAYRREAFAKAGGFDERLLNNEDHDLARRVARLGIGRFSFLKNISISTSARRVKRLGLLRISILYSKSSLVYLMQHGHVRNYWEL